VVTASEMKTKSLSEGNVEKTYTKLQMEELSKPLWSDGWTRFPSKGN